MNSEEVSAHEAANTGLNVDRMKLGELKKELKRRKIKSSGNKADLVCRLRAALVLENERDETRRFETSKRRYSLSEVTTRRTSKIGCKNSRRCRNSVNGQMYRR